MLGELAICNILVRTTSRQKAAMPRHERQGAISRPGSFNVEVGAAQGEAQVIALSDRPHTLLVPNRQGTLRSRKPGALFPALLALIMCINLGAILGSDVAFHDSRSATSTPALLHKTIPNARSTVASTTSANMFSAYYGTIYNIAENVTTEMSLTGIQQSQGNIHGYFSGLHVSAPFRGFIDASKNIQFTVAGYVTLSFEGSVQPDGNLEGSFCRSNQKGQCDSGEYGVWNGATASSGG